jgi:hypothetical protein
MGHVGIVSGRSLPSRNPPKLRGFQSDPNSPAGAFLFLASIRAKNTARSRSVLRPPNLWGVRRSHAGVKVSGWVKLGDGATDRQLDALPRRFRFDLRSPRPVVYFIASVAGPATSQHSPQRALPHRARASSRPCAGRARPRNRRMPRLAVMVLHVEVGVSLLGRPRRREAAAHGPSNFQS